MHKSSSSIRLKEMLEELARLGSPVDLSVAAMEVNNKVEIEQIGSFESQLFELEDGRAGYLANVAVTNQTSRTIDVVDVDLRAPWDEGWIDWLVPRHVTFNRATNSGGLIYAFPGRGGLELGYDEVINHRLLEAKKLPGKGRIEGWLMAIGSRIPAELQGSIQEVTLTIVGSDVEYSATVELCIHRLGPRTKTVRPRSRILAWLREEDAMRSGVIPRNAIEPPGKEKAVSFEDGKNPNSDSPETTGVTSAR